jgi:hypothetical protein
MRTEIVRGGFARGRASRLGASRGASREVTYNGIHLWMHQSDHAQRMGWIETVNEVEKLA